MAIKIIVDPNKGLYQQPTDGTSSFDVEAGVTLNGFGGGGGGTVIDAGGTIGGVYEGDVLCLGNVTFDDDVTINGKLIVDGNLTNDIGAELVIKGDLVVRDLNFNNADLSLAQSNITVDGNMTVHNIYYRQGGGVAGAATLRVGGNLISSVGASGGEIEADGYNAEGATIIVYGDISGFYRIYLKGADATVAFPEAFQGGDLTVYGSLTMIGGGDIELLGGEGGTYSNGGQGGSLYVYGNITAENTTINLNGGNATDFNGGYGGTFECNGDCITFNINTDGGDVTYVSTGGNGGNGGNVSVYGNIILSGDLYVNGGIGRGDGNNGGNAANIAVYGDVIATNGSIQGEGGNCNGNQAGNGGNFNAYGNVTCNNLSFSGGGPQGLTNIVGGNGGFIDVYGDLIVKGSLDNNGGSANSTSKSAHAGNGGTINALSLYVVNSLNASGGDLSGATTEPNLGGGAGANGGNVTVKIDLYAYEFYNNGGNVTTFYKTRNGGNGGNVTVDGNLKIASFFESNGGDSVGLDGGNSGQLHINGTTHALGTFNLQGGDSDDSSGGDVAGTNGFPQDCYFDGGVHMEDLYFEDGIGTGAAPSTDSVLRLGGSCFIQAINATNRAGIKIQPSNAYPAILKVNQLTDKTTLNKSDGTATGAIFSPIQQIYVTGYNSGTSVVSWYAFTGLELT